ncbi:MAG: hypothetical protein KTR25_01345 [Myxococcales bacterium]|nr:hypothetical protein [Myxococcales bacterium]
MYIFNQLTSSLVRATFIAACVTYCTELKSYDCQGTSIPATTGDCQPSDTPPNEEESETLPSPDPGDNRSILPSDAIFAFDYEQDIVIPDVFELNVSTQTRGSMQISSERAFSGQKSVKFIASGGGYNRNYMTLDISNNVLREQIYGRMMIFVVPPLNGNGGDFTFVEAEGNPSPTSLSGLAPPETMNVLYRYRVAGVTRDGTLMASYDTWIDEDNDGTSDWLTDCRSDSDVQLPRNQWACVQWHFDTANNQLRYWLDNEEIIDVQNRGDSCIGNRQNGVWTAPENFNKLHLGIEQYFDDDPPRTIYIDDVVIDDSYLACP